MRSKLTMETKRNVIKKKEARPVLEEGRERK